MNEVSLMIRRWLCQENTIGWLIFPISRKIIAFLLGQAEVIPHHWQLYFT